MGSRGDGVSGRTVAKGPSRLAKHQGMERTHTPWKWGCKSICSEGQQTPTTWHEAFCCFSYGPCPQWCRAQLLVCSLACTRCAGCPLRIVHCWDESTGASLCGSLGESGVPTLENSLSQKIPSKNPRRASAGKRGCIFSQIRASAEQMQSKCRACAESLFLFLNQFN